MPIVLATVVYMVIGALWYSPALFGIPWMEAMGFKQEDLKGANIAYAFGFVLGLGMAAVLSVLITTFQIATVDKAIELAFFIWLGFIATTSALPVIFENRSLKVYTIGASYHLVAMVAMAALLASWR